MIRLFIAGKFPGMNEILSMKATKFGKSGANAYNATKQKWAAVIGNIARSQRFPRVEKGYFTYLCREENMRRDPLNLSFGAIKIIEDALQECDLLSGDGQKNVLGFIPYWVVDKEVQGVTLFVADRLLTRDEAIEADEKARKKT